MKKQQQKQKAYIKPSYDELHEMYVNTLNQLRELDNVIAQLPNHVYWKDLDQKFIGCNRNQAEAVGETRKSVIGKTTLDLPWRSRAEQIHTNNEEVIATGKTIQKEEYGPRSDNSKEMCWYLSTKSPLRNLKNKVIGTVGISVEITDKKQEEFLQEKEREILAEKSKTLALASAAIAHELRTPLAAIQMLADTLDRVMPALIQRYEESLARGDEPLFKHYDLDYIKEKDVPEVMRHLVRKSNFFINMMLAKDTDESQFTSHRKPFDMLPLLKKSLEEYPMTEQEVPCVHISKKSETFIAFGNDALFEHVIFNLLKNALYYIKDAGKGDITLWCEKHRTHNEVHFKDTGKGIKEEKLDTIFERFYTHTRHGSGVGLAFCKMAIEKSFEGKIRCESQAGEYTHFIITLPLCKA